MFPAQLPPSDLAPRAPSPALYVDWSEGRIAALAAALQEAAFAADSAEGYCLDGRPLWAEAVVRAALADLSTALAPLGLTLAPRAA